MPVLPPENRNVILYRRVLFLAVCFSETKTILSKKLVKKINFVFERTYEKNTK